MKILFANLSPLKFDAETPEREPLGGTESCVCYLGRQLAENGHAVTLAARLPEGTPDSVSGIRHRPIAVIQDRNFFAAEKFDVVVTVSAAITCPRIGEISPASLKIFWNHLPPDQPTVRPLSHPAVRESIDAVVYVSEWQKILTEKNFGMAKPCRVIANGVTPSFEGMFASPKELMGAKRNRTAYTSSPERGLPILLDAMEGLKEETAFDIFSSMRVYQRDDAEYKPLFERARNNPRVSYYGSVSQRTLAEKLKTEAFLAYPCVMPETFCIASLEALAAGMKVIATDTGGIAATTMGFADLLPVEEGESGEAFVARYRRLLESNIAEFKARPEAWADRMFDQVQAVNRRCTWALRTKEWEDFLAGLLREKSLVETRRSAG